MTNKVQWQIAPGVRADIIAFAAVNLQGKRNDIRVFPQGARKGGVPSEELRSLVVMAPYGTRIILKTTTSDHWEDHPWRCIHIRKGDSVKSPRKTGLPGVRIPDIDLLCNYDAKRVDRDREASFVMVNRLDDGEGWTFGRGSGQLKGRIRAIQIDRGEDGPAVASGDDTDQATPTSTEHPRLIVVYRAHEDHVDAATERLERMTRQIRGQKGVRFAELWVTEGADDQFTLIIDFDDDAARDDWEAPDDSIEALMARGASAISVDRLL